MAATSNKQRMAFALSQPLVIWVGVGVAAILAIRYLLPLVVEGLKKTFTAASDAVREGVDTAHAGLESVVGPADSQIPAERSRLDQVKGLVLNNEIPDRALSDLVDDPFGYFKGLIFGTGK